MGLADRLTDTPAAIHGKPCSVGALVAKLEGTEDGKTLHSWLYELGVSQNRIYKALEADGHIVGEQSINRHRSRSCRCFKATS